MGAGVVGVILALAGVHSPVRTALVILFLIVAPTAASAGLLRSFDPFARLILSVVTALAVLSIVATILLSAGLWSPIGELVAVAVFTALCLVAQIPSVRARVAAWAGPRWRALLRHIPGLRTVQTGPRPAAQTRPAETGVPEDQQAGAADTGNASAAESTGASEPTTPLPAIRD